MSKKPERCKIPIDIGVSMMAQGIKNVFREIDPELMVTMHIDAVGRRLVVDSYTEPYYTAVLQGNSVKGDVTFSPGYYIRGMVKRDNAVLIGYQPFDAVIEPGIVDAVMEAVAMSIGARHDYHLSLIAPQGDGLFRLSLLNEPYIGFREFKARTAELLPEGTFCVIDEQGFRAIPGAQLAAFIGKDSCPVMRIEPSFKDGRAPAEGAATLPVRIEDVEFLTSGINQQLAMTMADGTLVIFKFEIVRNRYLEAIFQMRPFIRFMAKEGDQQVSRFMGQVGQYDAAVVVTYRSPKEASFEIKRLKEL